MQLLLSKDLITDMVKLFILLANICLPAVSIFLAIEFPATPFRWWFSLLITLHVIARMWETFFTSKEKEPRSFEGDWTLAVGTFAYIGLCFVIVFEFFLIPKEINFPLFFLGLVLYIFASRLRWWGQAALGKQWAIHVVGEEKIKKHRLLQIGPYEFIRHPIYSGILIEEIALPVLANTYYALGLAALVNIPLLLMRLFIEEKKSLEKFGDDYSVYCRETGRFFPKRGCYFLFFKKMFTEIFR